MHAYVGIYIGISNVYIAFLPRTKKKKNRGRGGYIVVYSPIKPNIYNIYPTFLIFHFYLNKNTSLL